ncbi:MAG TPA: PaaI family thioesterase [Spirochaetota bacterium]|nr:PaaI family thioesterase [Spirochaetota bacterium]HOM38741.1 PaaI family thioesterase [Spirochaetota bacterium]HPQ49539.1 PaaI family thioesterase [Spirochaetota bacterium]
MQNLIKIENPFTKLEGYNCFGCSPTHEHGLKLNFFYNPDEDCVISFLENGINNEMSGFPNIVHGGIQSLILDEIMFWIIYHKYKTIAVTATMNIKFKKPLRTNEKIIAKGILKEVLRDKIFKTEGYLLKDNEVLCIAEATYIKT